MLFNFKSKEREKGTSKKNKKRKKKQVEFDCAAKLNSGHRTTGRPCALSPTSCFVHVTVIIILILEHNFCFISLHTTNCKPVKKKKTGRRCLVSKLKTMCKKSALWTKKNFAIKSHLKGFSASFFNNTGKLL